MVALGPPAERDRTHPDARSELEVALRLRLLGSEAGAVREWRPGRM
ncbi:hypothetical protein ACFWXK_34005 [Streptomyces sp. NPDC059070]